MNESDADRRIIDLLRARDGEPSDVELSEGRVARVLNIAWGYDQGDVFAHVTTNVSPSIEGTVIDFFSTAEVSTIRDTATGAVLLSAGESPDSRGQAGQD